MSAYKVVWRGPVHKGSGLGIASREYVKALRRQGVEVEVGKSRKGSSKAGIRKKKTVLIYHYPPHTLNFRKERKRFDRIILNTVWETTRIPDLWRPYMNRFDAVFVPSEQNKRAMRNSGVKVPVFLVPHGVNTRTFSPRNRKLRVKKAKRRFVFVSVFGFQHRKNPETLLRAYWEEFSAADRAALVIKTDGYGKREDERWIRKKVKAYKKRLGIRKKTAPLVIRARRMSKSQLKGIYTLGDVFVLPTRGEGVGLPFLESLASGVPVIATGWGGHMDFLTKKNAFFVRYKLRNPASGMKGKASISRTFSDIFAQKDQRWAEADLGSLKKQMRAAYSDKALCKKKGRQGRRDALHHSWNRAGRTMKQAVEKVIRKSK
ncbi:glycosyltransferase [Paenibacillus beijingensis]|uniref:Glycosyl transferase family 1 n=1 Tax=Paenibacillus beijingensis TaxID=1126833 RepID=A0A0D5NHX7_9BACL|nr:glycosyltransferase [Paenibacillus beijingensis]AJY74700.1 glycosyl transferase family 1 [Paenibacillus beijingensis]